MKLWLAWLKLVYQLRGACSRQITFFWMVLVLMSISVRDDLKGVTSFVRSLSLREKYYDRLLDFFHSSSVNLEKLTLLWVKVVLTCFPGILRINGKLVLVGDGLKIPKAGKKMPGVKTLHQESEDNNKNEFILGHSCQVVSIISKALGSYFAVPLASRIHEGVLFNKIKRTLLEKMVDLIQSLKINIPFYFVADAYYASKVIINGLLKDDNHLITRVKLNAVAYMKARRKSVYRPGAGRKKLYGPKLHLWKLLARASNKYKEAPSPVYGEKNVTIKYISTQLLWKPVGIMVMFVAVIHPTRGKFILLCTDLRLDPLKVIELYGLRFKIEVSFFQSIHTVGAYSYRFWMMNMGKTKMGDLDWDISDEAEKFQKQVKRKLSAYHCHIQLGVIAQGLMQYLSMEFSETVWKCFKSWLRTIRPNIPPSENVVRLSLQRSLPEFLVGDTDYAILREFWVEKIDFERSEDLGLAA